MYKFVLDYKPIVPEYRLLGWGAFRSDSMVLVALVKSEDRELIRFDINPYFDLRETVIEDYRALIVKLLAELPVGDDTLNDLEATFDERGRYEQSPPERAGFETI